MVEDTDVTLDEIREQFGDEVAELVDGVTKLGQIEFESLAEQQSKNLRKMLIAMAKDIRVILIKLADRLHNMRTLAALPPERRSDKARETLEIYAPLAHRLGISQSSGSSRTWRSTTSSRKFHQVSAHGRREPRRARERTSTQVIEQLHDGAGADRHRGRDHRAAQAPLQHLPEDGAAKVRTSTRSTTCRAAGDRRLGEGLSTARSARCTRIWKPVPGRFKDYVAMPKFNMYQSLHTTVIGPAGRPLEIQIRTEEMHRTAEYGIAAHWRYKEGGRGDETFDERLAWLRQMLEWQTELKDPREFMEALKIDLFEDEVFVFTPKGDVISLRRGSTPIDFAYAIHTEVGNHCVGAKVNGAIVPLAYELQMGDRIEILTNKNAEPEPRLAQHRQDLLGAQQDPQLLLQGDARRRPAARAATSSPRSCASTAWASAASRPRRRSTLSPRR